METQAPDSIIVYRSPSDKLIAETQYDIMMAVGNFFWDNWLVILGGLGFGIFLFAVLIPWFQDSVIKGRVRR